MLIILDIRALPVVCNVGLFSRTSKILQLSLGTFFFVKPKNSIMKHSFRYYLYSLPSYWIIIALGYLFFIFIIVAQFSVIKSHEKQIMDLKKQLIHIQGCHEIMQSVERVKSWENERQQWEREIERDRHGNR